ncbi:MAG TPA: flagellar motor switch protein FliM [Bryobacteraceae bacterium]|nr:flagellar motor switch protein FliM [Bryobacteraceae bacterium]
MKRELSQQEIDAVFQGTNEAAQEADTAAVPFDFGRLDKIPKSQLRAIHLLHENFVRTLVSSLSAYLRAYITLNLVSLEQISYAEFLDGISSPTCIAYIGLSPYDEAAVLELSPSLAFALVEILLGGNGQSVSNIKRKITEIEKGLLQNLLRVILQDLSEAWKSISEINFEVQSLAGEPQLLHVLAPSEAVVAIAIEGRLGASTGMLNLAIPSIFFKRLRHRFEQQSRQVRRSESTLHDQAHMAHLIKDCTVVLDARLEASTISASALLSMDVGDVLDLDCPLHRQMTVRINERPKFRAEMRTNADRLAVQIVTALQQERPWGPPAPKHPEAPATQTHAAAEAIGRESSHAVNQISGVLHLAEAVAHATTAP